jgi:hypothetical protein
MLGRFRSLRSCLSRRFNSGLCFVLASSSMLRIDMRMSRQRFFPWLSLIIYTLLHQECSHSEQHRFHRFVELLEKGLVWRMCMKTHLPPSAVLPPSNSYLHHLTQHLTNLWNLQVETFLQNPTKPTQFATDQLTHFL